MNGVVAPANDGEAKDGVEVVLRWACAGSGGFDIVDDHADGELDKVDPKESYTGSLKC